MTKAFLMKLAGMGDQEWKLLNQEAWDHLEACCNWHRGKPIPQPSDALVADMIAWRKEQNAFMANLFPQSVDGMLDPDEKARREAIEHLTMDPKKRNADNDMALSLPGSLFNGERFHDHEPTVKALTAFVAKHGLDFEEVYDGHIY